MKATLLLIVFLLITSFVSFAQDTDLTGLTNNWNNMADLAPTEASWDYALTPGWYFYFGMGFGILLGFQGLMARIFQSLTGAGDSGTTT